MVTIKIILVDYGLGNFKLVPEIFQMGNEYKLNILEYNL